MLFGQQTSQELLYTPAHWMIVERSIGSAEVHGYRTGVMLTKPHATATPSLFALKQEAAAAQQNVAPYDQLLQWLGKLSDDGNQL